MKHSVLTDFDSRNTTDKNSGNLHEYTEIASATSKTRKIRHETVVAFLFLAPTLFGFLVFYLVPMIRGIQISFTEWDMLSPPKFIWINNYLRVFHDEHFANAIFTTAIYVLVNISSQTIAGLAIALLMQRISQSTLIRSLLLVPWLVPNVTIAVITLFMLDPNIGLFNHLLGLLAIDPIPFYNDPKIAIYTVALVNSWRNMGYTALLIFAGMQMIPKMIYEAAEIDGASQRDVFFRITLPLIRPILVMVVVVSMIGSFQIFDTVAVATKGGPIASTRVIYYYIYQKAFDQGEMGYAASMAVILLLIIVVMTIMQLKLTRASETDLD